MSVHKKKIRSEEPRIQSEKKQGPLFFLDCLNSSVPGLLQGVTLPFFLSVAFLFQVETAANSFG